MNEVAKRNTLFTSIHCEEVVYSKQHCLWNRLLFEIVHSVHRILSLQLTVVENKTFKVKKLIKHATYFTHEGSWKRNTLFESIHWEKSVYSKQYCLWNWSLFGNGTVSAQNTVIAVNCRWEQNVQGKKTLINPQLTLHMNEVAKRHTLFTSIHCE